jgi:hypothetical protein
VLQRTVLRHMPQHRLHLTGPDTIAHGHHPDRRLKIIGNTV